MAYTAIDSPEDYFITHNYSGNDTTNNQTSLGMTPDLVWVKSRNTGSPTQHYIVDKVRGDEEYIISNSTAAEATDSNTFALVSGGFNLDGGNGWTNLTGRTYVAWNWKAGGSGSSNTDGSITSTVSVNTDAGFSIVKWTGDDSTATIGTGLNAVPKMIITKRYDAIDNWFTYHHSLGNTKYMLLEANDAEAVSNGAWDDTSPTSSVFTKDSATNIDTATYIAYCFTGKQGYSSFGSYTGNGNADGTFVYTGFRPAFVLIKRTDSTGNWLMYDNKREGYNPDNDYLLSDTDADEGGGGIDIVSNGFKVRTTNATWNADGGTYLYCAFAEAPFVNSNGVPCNAR